jgi:iron complex outermembrane receptor protein
MAFTAALIPPLSAQLALRYDRPSYWAEIESRMAMPQERVARQIAVEDVTDGYFVMNVRGSYTLRQSTSLRFGIDNLFDTLYHEHLSFGNLPNEGRNVYLSVSHSL